MIDTIQINMLKLLAAALHPQDAAEMPDLTQWQSIKKELEAQAVLPLVSDYLMKAAGSDEEKLELTKTAAINVRTFHKIMTAQTDICRQLEEKQIPAVILKGAAVAQYYARPEYRQYGDIDVLVPPADYDRAAELFFAAGYPHDEGPGRHTDFILPNGVRMELHRYFSDAPEHGKESILDTWLYEALNHPQKGKVSRYEAPVLPTLENGLTLLYHISHHINGGLGLRQIIDWMQYAEAELTDAFWQEQFLARAEAIGLVCLAKTVTKMCRLYMGMSSEATWYNDADDALAEELLRYILKRGNFGRKLDKGSVLTLQTMHKMATPAETFRYLAEAGCKRMEEHGYKPCKAIAWLFQIGHLIRMFFKQPGKGKIVREAKDGVREMEMLKKLQIPKV